MLQEILQWSGCVTGVLGSALLACRSKWSGWGFALFLFSNGLWIDYGILTHTFGLIVMQVAFTVTSIIGIWRWLVLPAWARTPEN